MYEITYVFKKNRKENLLQNKAFAKELYYNLPNFQKLNNVAIIEFEEPKKNKFILKNIEHKLSKLLSLPFYFSKILNFQNLKILINSKNIIMVNESVACSLLPFLLLLKFFKNVNIIFFVMGLYSKKLRYPVFKPFHNLVIKMLYFSVNHLMFLGLGELEKAKELHNSQKKIVYFPFCIDTEFWNLDKSKKIKKEYVIFVGNDSNRDTNLLLDIAANLNEIQFLVVSNLKALKDSNSKNLKVIPGEWGGEYLTDQELKKLYSGSRICIIPLIESSQPSGQSVSLQAMSMEVPVIISKTSGFWEKVDFVDEKNIYFINDNDVDHWVKKINEIYYDKKKLDNVAKSAKELINSKYNLNIFDKKLKKYIVN